MSPQTDVIFQKYGRDVINSKPMFWKILVNTDPLVSLIFGLKVR